MKVRKKKIIKSTKCLDEDGKLEEFPHSNGCNFTQIRKLQYSQYFLEISTSTQNYMLTLTGS